MSAPTYDAAARVERVSEEYAAMKEAGTLRADPEAERRVKGAAESAITHGVKAQQTRNPIARVVHGRAARRSAKRAEREVDTLKHTDDGAKVRTGMPSDTRELKMAKRLEEQGRRAEAGTRDKQDPALKTMSADTDVGKRVGGVADAEEIEV
ncbi:uncharacterized protein SCHCODRAFT_02620421 [Schizophyllum commune H4-8]|uniref:uncharacterized protein n=1 Tax=Schizophyllum commune (strain H4-8 / FGSC 9210) TaxID=578458 RepID=UPI002160A3ED|nr:uncharacterized protein SCHCODRAFT_02620421 [Schizophyllum commune H4-8]KAI5895849.1 hypothetical protein SCHCODRAFT_02620421 [Schizophyllum commune H4-8]